jgi:hypothetical protein
VLEMRLSRALHRLIIEDLLRPHPFAYERVGFVFGRLNTVGNASIIYLDRYKGVSDERYIESKEYGALIDDIAILDAMQEVRSRRGNGEGGFHVHVHEHKGRPGFSLPDQRSLPNLVPGIGRMDPTGASGLLLLSNDNGIAHVWMPGSTECALTDRIVVAGAPLGVFLSGGD